MAAEHRRLTLALHRTGALVVLSLTALVAAILWLALEPLGAGRQDPFLKGTLVFVIVCSLLELATVWWLKREVVERHRARGGAGGTGRPHRQRAQS